MDPAWSDERGEGMQRASVSRQRRWSRWSELACFALDPLKPDPIGPRDPPALELAPKKHVAHISVQQFHAPIVLAFGYDAAVRKRKGSFAGISAGAGVLGLLLLSLGTPDACGMSSNDLIGPEGGTLRSDDGLFTLDIPEGALSEDVEMSIHDIDCELDGEAGCYEVRPVGIAFSEPAVASYEATELMSMESVSIVALGTNGWWPLADADLDREEEVITASVMYLSSFSVRAQ